MPAQTSSPPVVERPTRVRYWVIVFAVTLAVITYIDRVSISFAAPFIRHDLGLSAVQLGWVFAAFGWAYALMEIPGGFLGDWIGPRKVLTRIVLWWSFFTAATGWATGFISLTVTRGLFGAGEAGCFPNVTRAFATWLPKKERVRAQGILWLSTRWGAALTPPVVAVVMQAVGWRHAFEIFGVLGAIWAAVFFLWYRDDPMKNPRLNGAERALLKESSKLAAGHRDMPWRQALRSRPVWMLCIQYFCHSYGWYFYMTWLPSYLRDGRHLAYGSTALFSALPLFLAGLGDPATVFLSGRLARTMGVARARRLMAYIGFTGGSVFLVLSTTIADARLAVWVIGVAAFFLELVMSQAWASTMDVGGKYAGTLSGAMNMTGNIGGALSPLSIGYMLSWTNNNWNFIFYVSAAVVALGIVCWAFLDPVTPFDARVGVGESGAA
ncbi:MAG: MFS transporter [Bryobacteraceae bacterium]|jgi:MFS family permease